MMDVLNLAHGALFLGGAYLAAAFAGGGWGGFLAALAVAAVVGLAAGALLSLMTEPLRKRSHLDQALLTLGVALVVGRAADHRLRRRPAVGAGRRPGWTARSSVLGAVYPTYRLVLIGVGAVLALLVYLVVERTRVGALVRATVADREMVAALGVDNRLVKAAVFAVGSLLATTAGVLGGPDLRRPPGAGRDGADPGAGGGGDRRARLGARRAGRRADHRAGRHARPGAAARAGLVHPVRGAGAGAGAAARRACSAARSRRRERGDRGARRRRCPAAPPARRAARPGRRAVAPPWCCRARRGAAVPGARSRPRR